MTKIEIVNRYGLEKHIFLQSEKETTTLYSDKNVQRRYHVKMI
jgi:hypothetical protein